mgnify:CR=1 FL=1
MPINSFLYPAPSTPSFGYNVANSCRFNSGSSDYLTYTPSSTTNQKTWTVSCWVKRSKLGSLQYVWGVTGESDKDYFTELLFNSSDQLSFRQGGTVGDPYETQFITNAVFRDVSSWYNIIVAADTTQSTESNRLKIYVNGEQITSFGTSNYPSQNENYRWHFNNYPHSIGRTGLYASNYFDGYITEWIDVDGSQLDQNSFGEFDSDSPNIWKPIDISELSLGTNGAYLDFEDSSALGNSVGNSNNYTANNLTAQSQSIDTCTNNFCTLNPLGFNNGTLSQGNLEIDQNGSTGKFCASTFQVAQGKWYFEAKLLNYGSEPRHSIGVGRNEETFTGNASSGASSIVYGLENTAVFKGNSSVFTYDSSPSSGDIYGVAFDLDNLKIYFHKNGTYANSGDPANGTGNVTTLVSGTDYSPITGALNTNSNSARNNDWQFNFGSPMYSISSGNSDANGHGNFEYSVPSGFFSLCSKNLAEFG